MSILKNIFSNPSPTQKKQPFWPQKVNKTPKLSQIQKYKVVQLIQLNPKQYLNPTLTPTIGESGTKKSKTTPKLSQI